MRAARGRASSSTGWPAPGGSPRLAHAPPRRAGGPGAGSRPGRAVATTAGVGVALAGRRSELYPLQPPWDAAPMLLAEPVLVDGEVRGAAVTISPTDTLRKNVLAEWLLLLC